ncbi:MAG: class I SAM-dependent methyltransferase [Myxococcaceae bacterium]|jgi:SAM-dependent methyltransferase|nr:class I SAM-dependent methyltransferase [Myxococcaceae bacterium]
MEAAEFEKHERLERDHWWFEGRRRCIAAVLSRELPALAQREILDVGCGTGGMFPMLQRYGKVSGAEYSADARARAHRNFPSVEVSACELPDVLPAGPFDVVTAFDVIEHVDDPVASLRSMVARLKPNGRVVVTVPALQLLWSQHDVTLQHRRRYSRGLLVEQLTAAGLRVTYDSFFNTGLFPVVAAARLVERVRGPGPGSDLAPVNPIVNGALREFFGAEARVLARGRLPIGVSLIAVGARS